MNIAIKKIIVISIITLMFIIGAKSQNPNFVVPLRAAGIDGGVSELVFGIHPNATYCIENDTLVFDRGMKLLEFELPPKPPSDIFDVRFVDNRTVKCMGEGLSYDIRGFIGATQRDTFRLSLQAGITAGDSIVFTWPVGLSQLFDSIKIGTSITTARRMDLNINRIAFFWEVTTVRIWSYGAKSLQNIPPLATPLYKPANNSVDVHPKFTLEWYGSIGATKYIIEIALDQNFTNIVRRDTNDLLKFPFRARNTYTDSLDYGKKYYWRVISLNNFGSATSEVFNFTTIPPPPPVPIQLYPANNDTAISVNPTLRWTKPEYAVTYHLQVSASSDFSSFVVNDSTLTDTLKQVSLEHWKIYYWRVKAKNITGSSPFSSTWSFKTLIPLPDKPILSSPANNDSNVALSPTLSWNATQYASIYELVVASDPGFTTIVYTNNNITATSQQIPTLVSYRNYYWRVRGRNYNGTGPYSDVWTFKTVLIPPEKVTLNSPVDNATGIILNPTLVWNLAERAIKYHYQVDTLITFTSPLFEDSSYSGTSRVIGPLINNQKYFWRVRGWNSKGYGEYSDTWNFTTAPFPTPTTPQLVYPQDGAPNISLTPTLKWKPTENAEFYFLEVSKDSIFSPGNRVFYDTTIVDTQKQIGPLNQTTRYFWRVKAKNKAGVGPYSVVFQFRTYGDEPANWLTPFIVVETAGGKDTLKFGVHPQATHGIDNALGEYELPPAISGFFDVRWISPPRRPGVLGEGTRINYLPFNSFTQVDTYRVRFQTGVGTYPINISWNKDFLFNICDSMRMRDEIGGFTVNLRMDKVSSISITNENVNSLLLIKWGARPLRIRYESDEVPENYVLYPCYPNPFNPETNIIFSLMENVFVSLDVFNILGEKIKNILNGHFYAGTYSTIWDGTDDRSQSVPGGVYYLRLTIESKNELQNNISKVQKLLLIK